MDITGILQALFLLLVANGMPILARNLLGAHLSHPVDCGINGPDGRSLLGPTKTIRGVLAALGGTACAAPLVGVSWETGTLFGLWTMLGDLGSSFLKRRLGVSSSESVLGLDQGVEALCPLLALGRQFAFQVADIFVIVAAFFVMEIVLSPLLYRLHIRDRPL
jgi:CDP-2,3-bis-(O-geranylgeranyl)-sn-glycerol synthase